MEYRIIIWVASVPKEVVKVNSAAMKLQELSGLEEMAYSLLNDNFEPIKAVLVGRYQDDRMFHQCYKMIGLKRKTCAPKGWYVLADITIRKVSSIREVKAWERRYYDTSSVEEAAKESLLCYSKLDEEIILNKPKTVKE